MAMLEYKARLYGRTFVKVGRFFPSSKLCSICGKLAERAGVGLRLWGGP
jgi:putative transposase